MLFDLSLSNKKDSIMIQNYLHVRKKILILY